MQHEQAQLRNSLSDTEIKPTLPFFDTTINPWHIVRKYYILRHHYRINPEGRFPLLLTC